MLGCVHDDAATDHPPTRSGGPQGPRPPPPIAAPDRAPAARSGDRHRARRRRSRTNTGATSYHLRKLASVGLVEETDGGHGRERPWRAATEMHAWTERDVEGDPDARAATDWLRRYYLRGFIDRYERWLDEQSAWPLDWQDAAGASDFALRLSPAGLAAFNAEIEALYERYRADGAGRRRSSRRRSHGGRRSQGRSTRPGLRPRVPARRGRAMTRPRRAERAPPLPDPDRAALAADRPAHPDHRAAGASRAACR